MGQLENNLTRVLKIEHPILQSGMGGVAGPDLVCAVSNAGGLGVLAALRLRPDKLRESIERVRAGTDRPFGVNIWLHDDLRPPISPDALSSDQVRGVQDTLNGLRHQLDLPTVTEPPAPTPDLVDDALQVMLDERIPVFSAAIGIPERRLIEAFHAVGTTVVAMVATVADAVEAVDRGVDVVVAQGGEAGGHRSHGSKVSASAALGTGTIALTPAVVDAVRGAVPIASAGGIVDGRGLAAALMLGAEGVLLGTRFVATIESSAHDAWKRELLAHDRPTVTTDALTGQWARVLTNTFVEHHDEAASEPLPSLLQASAAADIFEHGRRHGDPDFMALYAGEGAASINDLPSAGEVVTRVVAEAQIALGRPTNQ